jgi:hypothetical protein
LETDTLPIELRSYAFFQVLGSKALSRVTVFLRDYLFQGMSRFSRKPRSQPANSAKKYPAFDIFFAIFSSQKTGA